jgi:predicted DCC family thiol-disulfide oxidoreductase YuxK
MRKYVLAYDADCGPCTRFKRAADFLDTYDKMDFMSLTEAENNGVLNAVTISARHRSFHLISPDGTALSGARAIPTLVSLLPSGNLTSELMIRAPGGLQTVGFVYSVFSRLHDTGSCRYRPGQGEVPLNKRLELLGSLMGHDHSASWLK